MKVARAWYYKDDNFVEAISIPTPRDETLFYRVITKAREYADENGYNRFEVHEGIHTDRFRKGQTWEEQ